METEVFDEAPDTPGARLIAAIPRPPPEEIKKPEPAFELPDLKDFTPPKIELPKPAAQPVAKPAAAKSAFSFPRPAPAPRPAPKPAFSFPRPTPQPAPKLSFPRPSLAAGAGRFRSHLSFGGRRRSLLPAPRPAPKPAFSLGGRRRGRSPSPRRQDLASGTETRAFGLRLRPSPRRRRSHLDRARLPNRLSTGAEAGVLVWRRTRPGGARPTPPSRTEAVGRRLQSIWEQASIKTGDAGAGAEAGKQWRIQSLGGCSKPSPKPAQAPAPTPAPKQGGFSLFGGSKPKSAPAPAPAPAKKDASPFGGLFGGGSSPKPSAPSPSPSPAPAAKPPPATTGGVPDALAKAAAEARAKNAAKQKAAADARKRQAQERRSR